ncbi:ABC transporter ATP-binding protein [Neobacillus terrae]|uniref:ABC transporter ATP-binding protein n=1 Tax=Neobacillus terrae TaxID=3034837 RepID=UPI00140AD53F|nr:ABC transporter ATP-binding protein [Neobacillus terrae]NHM31299.1 ABC transporter ATP-binding protein [Neobacillus terrae]
MAEVVLNHVIKRFGNSLAINDLNLSIDKGELVSFLGPSGCGKTTTLRMIAGFLEPDEGDILIHEENVTRIPANKRDTALVFQNYALFPHMTIFENVAFGLKMRKVSKEETRSRVLEALSMVQLEKFGDRYPRQISGGQQQRVALARALVVNPRLLLLDEPLSNLDAKLRQEMRSEIRQLQQRLGITSIFVTHDQEEALVLSDRIVVLEQGEIRQIGRPQEVYDSPQSHFVADFVGVRNFFNGHFESHAFITNNGIKIFTDMKQKSDFKKIGIRSNMIVVNPNNKEMYINTFKVKVELITYKGTIIELLVLFPTGDSIVVEMPSEQFKQNTFSKGDQIDICWRPDSVLPLSS